ncbi:uncharacterized protein LOC108873001 [Lates calcarifer]|uniref:Uncharacterized protein LOC108873001 n=1 Tax=Lates calcarifer TaxID=8187 RepID=A0AAJ7LAH7_LATCA|nr:uncharacterized protein LOC108873001 [Lates calcarifer]
MAAVCQPRRALVEIPAPQPKIAARMRRSYLEILSGRLAPNPLPRGRNTASNTKRVQPLDLPIGGVWSGRIEEQCEKMDEHHTPLSKQQLVQLIRSLILVEQSQEPRNLASDLKYLQEDLQLKKANVYRSIPYSRFGSNRDAHCYRKAYPHLVAFKVSCQEWGQVLLRNKEWDACVGAHADGVALHQRVATVGYSESQRSQRTVLQHSGSSQPLCSPALPPRTKQRTRAAQKVEDGSAAQPVNCSLYSGVAEDYGMCR